MADGLVLCPEGYRRSVIGPTDKVVRLGEARVSA